MTTKIDFFIRCRAGGGFIARSQAPVIEAEGETLAALRVAVKRAVRVTLGEDQPVCLRVGANAPVLHIAIVPPSAELAAEP